MLSNKTLRLVIILAALSIVGITATQIYWVRQAFDLHQDEFERDVKVALYSVAKEIFDNNKYKLPKENPVEQVSRNYFVVNLGKAFEVSALEEKVQTALTSKNIDADFEYGIYNCHTDQMVYCNYVNQEKPLEVVQSSFLPKSSNQEYYFGVYFPSQFTQVANRMGVWIYSSVVLLLVILFFAFTLFVILKQRRLSEVQRDFINNLTHEFKTPISTINISAAVLQNPEIAQTPQRLLNYATIIQKESDRLQGQVDKVLEAAKVDYTSRHLDTEEANVHDLLTSVTEDFQAKYTDIDVNLNLQADQNIVKIDVSHITNVFHNLIDNAIKYCDTKPSVEVSTVNKSKTIEVAISDNGMGIQPEEQKKIFGKFYRTSTGDRHDVKGFGLGLHYVKYIVDAHGGDINVKSSDKGSTFTISLSLA